MTPNTKHTDERAELLKAHHAAMNAVSDFAKAPSIEREQSMRKAEGEFRALLADDKAGGEVAIDVMIAQTEKPVPTYIDDSTGYAHEYFTEQDLEQYGRELLSAFYTRPQPDVEALAQARRKALDGGHRVFKDGNSWCAVGPGFINLQESIAAFGGSPVAALSDLTTVEILQGEKS